MVFSQLAQLPGVTTCAQTGQHLCFCSYLKIWNGVWESDHFPSLNVYNLPPPPPQLRKSVQYVRYYLLLRYCLLEVPPSSDFARSPSMLLGNGHVYVLNICAWVEAQWGERLAYCTHKPQIQWHINVQLSTNIVCVEKCMVHVYTCMVGHSMIVAVFMLASLSLLVA